MPKSKRNKQVELAKTKKHGLEGKKHLYNEVRSCMDTYTHLFIFSVNDMRNSKMKSIREQWKHSRFFIGKNKVMAMALGRSPEEEYRPNLHKIGERLKGERGLLFSNQPAEEVVNWFSSYKEGDYARSGNIATENVTLLEGPLPQFAHSLESYLRQLGLPTTLQKGVVHLVKDHIVCNQGDRLTPETAKIVKLLGYEMAEFQINIECVWSQDGTFQDLKSDTDSKEVTEKVHKAIPSKTVNGNSKQAVNIEDEAMDVMESNKDLGDETDSENYEKISLEQQTNEEQISCIKSQSNSESQEQGEKDVSEDEEIDSDPEVIDSEKDILHDKEGGSDPELEVIDHVSVMELTQQKIKNDATPKKYSPKLTRARAQLASVKKTKVSKENDSVQEEAAALTEIKSPEEIALRTRSARKANRRIKPE